jgi:hypothetical protein
MARRLKSERTKVGEHNGIDIYFSTYDKRFSARWQVYRSSLWAKSYDGLTKKLDRIGARVFVTKPQAVFVEDYKKGINVYVAGKTTGRYKHDDQFPYRGSVEVDVKGKRSWYSTGDVYLGNGLVAQRLTKAAIAADKAERHLDELRKGLKRISIPKRQPPKPKKVTTTSVQPGNGTTSTISTVQ